MIKHLILILTLTTASLPLHARLTEPNTYRSQVDRLNHYANQARDHKIFDDATQTLNFMATGKVPNSDQSVPIRTTGPTDEEWVGVIRAMYNLTQTTFNPYTLLKGLDENSPHYGHRLGTFLAYQLTKLYTRWSTDTLIQREIERKDYSSLSFLLVPAFAKNDNTFVDYAQTWLRKFLNYNDQSFSDVFQAAGGQHASTAHEIWERRNKNIIEVNPSPDKRDAFLKIKAYAEGDDSVRDFIEHGMSTVVTRHIDGIGQVNEFLIPSYFIDDLKVHYLDARNAGLNLRSPLYKGEDLFSNKMAQQYQLDEIRAGLEQKYPLKKDLISKLLNLTENAKWNDLNEELQKLSNYFKNAQPSDNLKEEAKITRNIINNGLFDYIKILNPSDTYRSKELQFLEKKANNLAIKLYQLTR